MKKSRGPRRQRTFCSWHARCLTPRLPLPPVQYLRPLYRALYANPATRQLALDTFAANKDMYHPIAAKMAAVDLKLEQ